MKDWIIEATLNGNATEMILALPNLIHFFLSLE
jgi:hypothetical protein